MIPVYEKYTDELFRWTGDDGYTYVITDHKPSNTATMSQEVLQAFGEGLEFLNLPYETSFTPEESFNVGGVNVNQYFKDVCP